MASLRARLLAAVLGITAAGLLLLAAITYAEQRAFLLERVDTQARAAHGAVDHALHERGVPGGEADRVPPDDRPGDGGRPHRPDGGPGVGLPPGTFGERRDPSGRVLGTVVFDYGGGSSIRPNLPANLPLDRLITVPVKGGGGRRFRVLAHREPFDATTTIVAIPMREVDETLARLLLVEGLVIASVLLVLGLIAWAVVRVGLRPLDRIADTAGAIAGGDLSHRVESTDPRTEVGRLGIALNRMLDRLEQAFAERQASEDRLRRFLADASHELRTPLASIRGYAELMRMGAASAPADEARAVRRIEQEAARMGVLVEDLLTLARLDETADAPHREVDIAQLVHDAVDDARAAAPQREFGTRMSADATVTGEPDQLRQVLANLLRNAIAYTPAASPIEVRLESVDGAVEIEVRDHGPGLPVDDPNVLFERFWRAEGGRERGRGGAGLGLAIAAAVVVAHGGRIEARNARSGGASFVVHLPARTHGRVASPAPAPA